MKEVIQAKITLDGGPEFTEGTPPRWTSELTKTKNPSRLVKEGNISMGQGNEQPQQPQEGQSPKKEARIEQARKAWERANQGRKVSIDEKRTQKMLIERGISPMRGGATGINKDDYADHIFRNIADEVNQEVQRVREATGQDNPPLDSSFVDSLSERVSQHEDADPANPAVHEQALRLKRALNAFHEEAERASRERRRRTDENGYGRGGREEKKELKRENAADLNVDEYTQDQVREIAREVKEAAERAGDPGVPEGSKPTTDFLRERIKRLTEILNTVLENDVLRREAENLWSKLHKYKDLLSAEENTERLKHVSDWSSYGEMKLKAQDKAHVVDLALNIDKKGNLYEIEKLWNQRLTIADSRSDVDWSEALQTAGKIELDDFIRALVNVVSGRITIPDEANPGTERIANGEEVEKINSVIRMINQELVTREYLHNLNYAVKSGLGVEEVTKYAGNFKTEKADIAFRKKGVAAAYRFYEEAMFQVMTENGWYLPSTAMSYDLEGKAGQVEKSVMEQLKMAQETGAIEKMEEWEEKRAISIARGMGILTGRFFEIAALGGLPRENLIIGWWANGIVNKFAFFRQLSRYSVGKRRLALLKYRIENESSMWQTKELTELMDQQTEEIFNRFINDDENSRLIDKVNPMRFGSVFTQTGWRWNDQEGAIADLVRDYKNNPIIGLGLWLEKLRGDLLDPAKRAKAEGKAREQIDLAIKVTPLKFFYNVTGLRQRVFRGSDTVGAINPKLIELYEDNCIKEDRTYAGKIEIKSPLFKKDLQTLSVIQQKLLQKRIDAYKKYLEAKKTNPGLNPPDLFSAEYSTFDYTGIPQEEARRVEGLANEIIGKFTQGPAGQTLKDRFVRTLEEKRWKIPYVFGTDDTPVELFDFAATGDESFKRRWGDISSAVSAQELFHKEILMKMPVFQSREEIVKSMFDVYMALKGHDENVTTEFMADIAEGVIKFYKKDIVARLPGGIGTFIGLSTGKASYAQAAFGRNAMAWDEIDIDGFIKDLYWWELLNPEQIKKLRKQTGAEKWNLALAIARTASQLGLLGLLYYILSSSLKDVAKENKLAA